MTAAPEIPEAAVAAAARRLCGNDADPACAGCTHRARAALAAAAPEIARAAWDEGFSAAWYHLLPYEDSRDASEGDVPNPYEAQS